MLIITGPTGNVGHHLIHALLDSGCLCAGVVHHPDDAPRLGAAGAQVVVDRFAVSG